MNLKCILSLVVIQYYMVLNLYIVHTATHAKCRSPYNLSTIKKTLSPRTLIFPWLGCRILKWLFPWHCVDISNMIILLHEHLSSYKDHPFTNTKKKSSEILFPRVLPHWEKYFKSAQSNAFSKRYYILAFIWLEISN